MTVTAAYVTPTRVDVRTSEPEIAHDTLVQGYSPTRPVAFSGNFDDFHFHTSSVTAGPISTATIRHSAATRALTEPYEPFIAGVARYGRLRFKTTREEVVVDRENVVRYSNDSPLDISWDDVDLLVIMFPLAAAAEAAVAHLDDDATPFRFTSTAPASAALSRFWRSTISYVDRELRADGSALGYSLVQAETLRVVAAAALTVFPNTAMAPDYRPGIGAVAPAVVRRAVAFVDANAERPITVAEIATAANIGVRGLQLAFLKHVGRTPMAYLRGVRLERAHLELRAADPTAGDTVNMIAARWGFTQPDAFSAAYRETFGVLPSYTLRT